MSAETPRDEDIPTGMPTDDAPESGPLGPAETNPGGDGTTGDDHMPGVPTEGEPPSAG
jgi:hypothetical protein